jgi:transcriptional regulator
MLVGMYRQAAFALDDRDTLGDLVDGVGAAHLVTSTADGLRSSLVPLLYDRGPGAAGLGTLRGHLARANDQWRLSDGAEALAIFTGPDGYVSPGWYPSKAADPRVVPTWDYVVVHVTGRLTVHDDPDWVLAVVRALTERHEASRPVPWSVDDAPADHLARLARSIVGVEVEVAAISGSAKLSQNRPADIAGVAAGLAAAGDPRSVLLGEAVAAAGAAAARKVVDGAATNPNSRRRP